MTASSDAAEVGVPFAEGDMVVYPPHGIGKIIGVESRMLGGCETKLFVIHFENGQMTLRLPFPKATAAGLRGLSLQRTMTKALAKLTLRPAGPPAGPRLPANRRGPEHLIKINSGDPSSIAEVVRELHPRPEDTKGLSPAQRELYDQALGRLTAELAAVEKIEPEAAAAKIASLLNAA